jgi:hypothetical protein
VGSDGGARFDRMGMIKLGGGGIKKSMCLLNNFFCGWSWELTKTLRQRPRRTHRKEVPGGGMAINTVAMMLDGRAAPPWWCSFLEVDGLSMYYSFVD